VCNREVIGIVTKIHDPKANPERSERWLRLAGCKDIFWVDSKTGEGIPEILEHLREPGDVMPWEQDENLKKQQKTNENATKPHN
jgi:ethanolamine utilization protein EutP